MSTISERIKMVRTMATDKKLSQEEFAHSLGLKRGAVANFEDAENRLKDGVPEHILRLISNTYHVRYEWLKNGDGEMTVRESPQEKADRFIAKHASKETEFAKAIIRAFVTMPDSEWIRLRDMIETIKKERDD